LQDVLTQMSMMSETIQLRSGSVNANNNSVNQTNGVPCEPREAVTCVITRPVRHIASTRKLSNKGIIIPIATKKAMVKKRQQGRKPSHSKCSSVGGGIASVARRKTGNSWSKGCANIAKKGGVCKTHGAKVKRCSHTGCTNGAVKGGVCVTHGAKKKQCRHEGCTNFFMKGGVCITHGAKVTRKCLA
jgi:hypothetical protein